MRKIPVAMATQHPDSALRYVPVQEEPDEALECFTSYGCDEYMVDYEGKLTPYHQTAQVVGELIEAGIEPGRDVFVTPRMPSASKENVFRQLMALMSIMEAQFKGSESFDHLAIVEVIHPMSAEVEELVGARKRMLDVAGLAERELGIKVPPEDFGLIPLVEEVPELLTVGELLTSYSESVKKIAPVPEVFRLLIGRSDPALSYGHVAASLECKVAVSEAYRAGEAAGFEISPILGAGTLPFRGHASPENLDNLIREYSGIRTLTLQSALRYDHGREATKSVVKKLKASLPGAKPLSYSKEERKEIAEIIAVFLREYLMSFYYLGYSGLLKVADLMPDRRDRLARKGALGYAREPPMPSKISSLIEDRELALELQRLQLDKLPELPRAIKFTGALYTVGLPPEIIGTGRGLKALDERGKLDVLFDYYPSLEEDLKFASRFLNLRVVGSFLPEYALKLVRRDVEYIYEYLAIDLGPRNEDEEAALAMVGRLEPYLKYMLMDTEKLLDVEKELAQEMIVRIAKVRKALG